jgi:arsenate reductase
MSDYLRMKIYHNPRCGKSRQALALLKENGKSPEIIRYLDTPPSKSELKEILRKLDISAEGLVRKNEKLFKDNFKGKEFSENEWLNLLIDNPKLIERPIVINGNKAAIGRPPELVLEIL